MITVGERAGWGSGGDSGDSGSGGGPANRRPLPERWVQFGAAASAQAAVEEGAAAGTSFGELDAGEEERAAGARTLRDYLALPVSEYALLDPKWIER